MNEAFMVNTGVENLNNLISNVSHFNSETNKSFNKKIKYTIYTNPNCIKANTNCK